jgi:hypothetical protein
MSVLLPDGTRLSSELPDLKSSFERLASERNMIVHGSWVMRDHQPYVVWHKFESAKDEIPSVAFPRRRFGLFMKLANHLFKILKQLLQLFERQADELRMM